MGFKKYLKKLAEETSTADIATVDTKLDMGRTAQKHLFKGKKCKVHKRLNCEECLEEHYEEYN